MNLLLNRFVRAYLRHFPVTEGKSLLLKATRTRIRPREAIQVSATKHAFSLRLNLDNPEHERIYFYGEHDERYEIALLRKLIKLEGIVFLDNFRHFRRRNFHGGDRLTTSHPIYAFQYAVH